MSTKFTNAQNTAYALSQIVGRPRQSRVSMELKYLDRTWDNQKFIKKKLEFWMIVPIKLHFHVMNEGSIR
jgi:hypothetical protein